jgi:hypothetical protein
MCSSTLMNLVAAVITSNCPSEGDWLLLSEEVACSRVYRSTTAGTGNFFQSEKVASPLDNYHDASP